MVGWDIPVNKLIAHVYDFNTFITLQQRMYGFKGPSHHFIVLICFQHNFIGITVKHTEVS